MPSGDNEFVISLERISIIVIIMVIGLYLFLATTYVNALLTYQPSTISAYGASRPPAPPMNRRPVADAGSDQIFFVNQTVYFDGSGSSDSDGEIVSYAWSFGDGANASGINVSHRYTAEGEYAVTLTVTDNEGAAASDTSSTTIVFPTPADIESLPPEEAGGILAGINDELAAAILVELNHSVSASIFEEMDVVEAAGIIEAAIMQNHTTRISEILFEMEQGAAAAVLLQVFPEHGADLIESMVGINITSCAYIVDSMVNLDVGAAADVFERVDTNILVELFIEVASLPSTPLTVALVFESMSLEKVINIVSGWVSLEAFNELGIVLGHLASETLNTLYNSLAISDRAVIFPHLTPDTVATIAPSLLPLPDIMPTMINVSRHDDTSYKVDVNIINQGNVEANRLTIELRADTTLVDRIELTGLVSKASEAVSFEWIPTSKGFSSIHVIVDSDNVVEEIDETNNELIQVFRSILPNLAPAAVAGADQKAILTEDIFFDGSGSSDPDGEIVSYVWSFGDGFFASGINVFHKYTTEGEYTATLTVTDDLGAAASDTLVVTLERKRETVISLIVIAFIVIFLVGVYYRWWY